ncbi:MAG: TIGR03564 family F420-dependent LLM class oxidoreductase [Acidimicrobiales bacterium]
MRIGGLINTDQSIDDVTAEVQRFADLGLASGWANQIFAHDTLTLLALVGSRVPHIELGTAVVPVHPRHPAMLAQQAATVQAAVDGRLALGIGLSHQVVVESMWGYSYDKPAAYMREYLSALVPMLKGEAVNYHGEMVTAISGGPLSHLTQPTPVYVAALGPVMLRMAGQLTDGTVTWMTGTRTIATHIAPKITEAASAAGRPAPRIVVGLPVCVTSDPATAKERIDGQLAIYPNLPSYRAMLDLEGAKTASDLAFVGTAAEVSAAVDRLAEAGATDFTAAVIGDPQELDASWALLSTLASR